MKNKLYIKPQFFATVSLIILLIGCQESFLELPSKTSLSTALYFKFQSDFQQAINGAYAPLRTLYNDAYYMGELRSDNTTYTFNKDNRSGYEYEYVADFLDDANNSRIPTKYYADYSIISRVNQVLEPIDAVDFTDKTAKDVIKGEAYFLRAFAYLDLVQYYGKVPLHLKPATTLKETALKLSSVDSVYLQIISDAKQAASLLPDKATQVLGRATSGAANTLLGNVYIVLKRWAEAETVLKAVTGYSLIAKYADVYDPNNKNNSESVFEIQYKEGKDGFSSDFFYPFLPQPITAAEINAVTGIAEEDRNFESLNIPTPDMVAAYEPKDTRKDASIGYITTQGKSFPFIKKYLHPHANSGNTNDNFPVYRYAEVLLYIAEALNEQGKSSEALTYINQVRLRAGLASSTTTNQAALRDEIMKERRVELAFENKRWLDLVRTGTAADVMTAFGVRVKANPENYYFPVGYAPISTSYTNIRLLFPIPASEVSLNPNMK